MRVRPSSIEDVQDIVQEELMRKGYFKVAESYSLSSQKKDRQEVGGVQEELSRTPCRGKERDGNSFSGWDRSRKEFLYLLAWIFV